MDLSTITNIIINVVANLVSAIILFIFGLLYMVKPKVKISNRIVRGIMEFDNKSHIAYQFKIVNKSRFLKARNFSVKLFAVKKIFLEYENVYTENYTLIEEIKHKGLNELSRYASKRKLRKIMEKSIGNSDFSCWYRIITTINLLEEYKDYDTFRLCVEYETSLNQKFTVNQYFDNNVKKITIGNFSTDGNLETVNPLSEEENNKYKIISNS
jgi:hypothetical protein